MERDWTVSFPTLKGKAGQILRSKVNAEVLFRAEKLVAIDSSGGMGTLVGEFLVDGATTKPRGRRLPSLFFSAQAVGNGLELPAGKEFEIEVEFKSDGQWEGVLFGKVDD